ncbi:MULTISPECIES: HEAT repeat domain-containing protein [unclassified Methanoculleus]|uniref:HEAT repeat domain-containing protein n=1 Tax=unclassified Methanoculleus TaxID=2619537 RepID=UPI0025F96C70|nr:MULTISPECIES: HEAT repeat domain-containing protein [unclassified Methanoculleus]MCK9317606.1 HEAT repeat domain-containing protein [Methanoculleus sp.]MDD2255163.1 HEAT repeat domain-containing protein [Methanoculleus sp.]MDD2787310.1 HEAT repeat domain-containing protein [Methanoculleus sp.]MDD3215882.1 HEAT repeat domain-containing protein [Methanoculleus sp.]MDD4314209.1 HEAT repeat domain-containing protein [Methanoculleus sp.]
MQRRDLPIGESREEKRYDLERMSSGRDINGLTEALQTGDPAVRRDAALALGALGEWRAVDPLIRALADPAQDVREGAANALVMVGTPAVDPLLDLLDHPEAAAVYGMPREAPEEGLTQVDLLGGPADIPAAKRRLRHAGGIRQHDALGGPADIREAGAGASRDTEREITQHDLLGGPGDVGTRKSLRHRELAQHDLLGGPADAREHERLFPGARRAGVVPEGALPGRGLRRAYAAVILGEIADPRAEGALGRALNDSDPAVRRAAGDGMARYRERRGSATRIMPSSR